MSYGMLQALQAGKVVSKTGPGGVVTWWEIVLANVTTRNGRPCHLCILTGDTEENPTVHFIQEDPTP